MNFIEKIYYKLFPNKKQMPMNRGIIKKDLKQYSRNNLITMICQMGNELIYYKKKYGGIK